VSHGEGVLPCLGTSLTLLVLPERSGTDQRFGGRPGRIESRPGTSLVPLETYPLLLVPQTKRRPGASLVPHEPYPLTLVPRHGTLSARAAKGLE
jgi:hypothetical protein